MGFVRFARVNSVAHAGTLACLENLRYSKSGSEANLALGLDNFTLISYLMGSDYSASDACVLINECRELLTWFLDL
ncbi:LOB domain-containing protein [Psidium guajava]|nr:LOB domain-containing protein [Psidium guajava]